MFWCVIYKDYDEDFIFRSFDVSSSFSFSTALNGGFATASLQLTAGRQSVYDTYSTVLGKHVVVYDSLMQRAFEGFISKLTLSQNTLDMEALGYYAKGSHIIDDRIYVTSPQTVSDIIMDGADLIDSWVKSESYQGGATYNIMTSDPDTGSILALDFTDKRVSEAIESVLVYGYSSSDPRQVYLVIYEGRAPRIVLPSTEVDLVESCIYIQRSNIENGGDSLSISLEQVFNKVYAVYANEGEGVSKTTAASGTMSISEFGTIEGVVQNGGNQEGITMAEALRDYALDTYQWPIQSASVPVSGVFTRGGKWSVPAHMIRAGDYVRFTDLDVLSVIDDQGQTRIKSKVFSQVKGTSYSASTGVNNLTLGLTDNSFDVLMSRLGLSGGMK